MRLGTILAVLALLLAACGDSKSPSKRVIAVIPKGTTHEFWKSIHAGALKAAAETGVDIAWKGPPKEDDRDEQIKVVEDSVTRRVAAIVLAPLDEAALATPVAEAAKDKIPVVVIDSDLKGDAHASFVATDNEKGGAMAAERLGTLLGGKGRVLMLRYQVGSASTEKRERGFLAGIAKFPGITMVSDNQYAGATAEAAYAAAENLLQRFPELDGIFCPNESATFGMLRALTSVGRNGKVKFVGFDASAKLAEALKTGDIHGLVLQNPFRMGYLGVKTALDVLDGKSVERRIDTGVAMATPDNMTTPDIAELLNPKLPENVR
ncbi:MAG: hypothetical protein RIS21_310 [Planctomycetota bacterium]|jgi:ribose transport system substrate-binding protein